MQEHKTGRAPNYTNACIIMFGVNLTWVLVVIWAIWGFIAAAILAMGINHFISRLQVLAARRHYEMTRRGKQI